MKIKNKNYYFEDLTAGQFIDIMDFINELKNENNELKKDMSKIKRYIAMREFIHITAIFKKWGIE